MQLKDKISIITGASSGIGRAIAIRFAEGGARVVIADIDEKEGQITLKQLADRGMFVKTDVSKENEVRDLVGKTIQRFSKFDIVVNNVGVYSPFEADISALSMKDFQNVVDTNFKSVFLLTKFVIPHLLKTKGSIINIASSLGLVPEAESSIYCSTKAAIIMFTKATALNYAKKGVRINCICPGPIDTPLLRKAFPDEKELNGYLAENPMGRAGTSREVANIALFLASRDASYVTGSVYTVDGGESLK